MRKVLEVVAIVLALTGEQNSWATEVRQQQVEMPGNAGFGFFQKPGLCRVRVKVRCDFAITSTRSPNLIAEIRFKDKFVRSRTDDDGIFDVKFRCPEDFAENKVIFRTAKFDTSFKLRDAPREIRIPDNRCNVELSF